ncbi:hypothetical protein EST38_g9047 [Candolleomyces aberdarensis]|uniref:Uncharacterized protein n=1 Tax=Candolleomyces aberdarensis TaxID=2316362 RepID=A0A4Q2DAX9_9AGAR|nr:hypothetical protein EST38_g9047 [Candolleomyces aberdarensis]
MQFAHRTAESAFLQSIATLNREIGRNRDADTEQGLNGSTREPTQTQASTIDIAQEKWSNGTDAEKVG